MKRTYKETIENILVNFEMTKEAHHQLFLNATNELDRAAAFKHLDKKHAIQDAISLILTETQGIES